MEAPWFEDGFPKDVRRSTPGARIDLIKDIVTNLVWLLVREIKKKPRKKYCAVPKLVALNYRFVESPFEV